MNKLKLIVSESFIIRLFTRNPYFLLSLIVLLGMGMRTYRLNKYSIWYDEKSSLSCAVGIPHPLITAAKNINWEDIGFNNNKVFTSTDFWKFNTIKNVYNSTVHSQGYFIVLHYWIRAFGTSDFAIRFLSVIFSCLVILLTYIFTKLIFQSHKIAVLAAFLTAINPIYIESAQYTRSHTMVLFLTLLSTYFYYRIFFKDEKGVFLSIAYLATMVISIFSHFYCVYIFMAQAIAVLIFIKSKKLWLKYSLINIIVLLVVLIYLINGGFNDLKIIGKVNDDIKQLVINWKIGDNPHYMPATVRTIAAGLVQAILPAFGNNLQSLGLRIREIFPLLVIPITFMLLLFYKLKVELNRQYFYILTIIFLSGPLFSLIMSLKSGFTIFFTPCYSMYSYPYAIILMASSVFIFNKLTPFKRNIVYSMFALQITIMFISVTSLYNDSALHRIKNPYPQIVQKVSNNYSEGDTLIYSNWLVAQTANLYLKNHNYILQKVNPNQDRQIILTKKSGKVVEIANDKLGLNY